VLVSFAPVARGRVRSGGCGSVCSGCARSHGCVWGVKVERPPPKCGVLGSNPTGVGFVCSGCAWSRAVGWLRCGVFWSRASGGCVLGATVECPPPKGGVLGSEPTSVGFVCSGRVWPVGRGLWAVVLESSRSAGLVVKAFATGPGGPRLSPGKGCFCFCAYLSLSTGVYSWRPNPQKKPNLKKPKHEIKY
jgi:hypothetical protein